MSHVSPRRLVLIKADDLTLGAPYENWQRLFDLVKERNICVSSGFISGKTRYTMPPAEWREWLLPYLGDSRFEFWNHGHRHSRGEFSDATEEGIHSSVRSNNEAANEVFGEALPIFGAPFNDIDTAGVGSVARAGTVRAIYFPPEESQTLFSIPAASKISFERAPSRNPDFETFVGRCRKPNMEALPLWVCQIHPFRWDQHGFDQFRQIISWLEKQHVQFVTAGEWISYNYADVTFAPDSYSHRKVRALKADQVALRTLDHLLTDAKHTSIDQYFVSRYSQGILKKQDRLAAVAEHLKDSDATGFTAVDIGCGVGDWAIAYLLNNEANSVIALDPQNDRLECVKEIAAQLSIGERLTVYNGTVGELTTQTRLTWSNRVMNLIDHELYLDSISRITEPGGLHYCGYQTVFFYLHAIVREASKAESKVLPKRLKVLVSSLGRVAGVFARGTREMVQPELRLHEMFKWYGFSLVDKLAALDQEGSTELRQPTIGGFLYRYDATDPVSRRDANVTTIHRIVDMGLTEMAKDRLKWTTDLNDRERADIEHRISLARGTGDSAILRVAAQDGDNQRTKALSAYADRDWEPVIAYAGDHSDPSMRFLAGVAMMQHNGWREGQKFFEADLSRDRFEWIRLGRER